MIRTLLEPLGIKIVLKPLDPIAKTEGGIYIPESAQEMQQEAVVLAVGSGKFDHGSFVIPEVKPGDIVLFSKFAGAEAEIDGMKVRITTEDHILARIKKVEVEDPTEDIQDREPALTK